MSTEEIDDMIQSLQVRKLKKAGLSNRNSKKKCMLYADTRSEFTIITPRDYSPITGKLEESDLKFRPWGGNNLLDAKGTIHTVIQNRKGAQATSKVYVIDGGTDVENLAIITFNKEGKEYTNKTHTPIKRIQR